MRLFIVKTGTLGFAASNLIGGIGVVLTVVLKHVLILWSFFLFFRLLGVFTNFVGLVLTIFIGVLIGFVLLSIHVGRDVVFR